jgi:hypothetical protein
MRNWAEENTYTRRRMPDAEIVGHEEEPLTYAQVASAFERSEPAVAHPDQAAPRD